MGIAAAGYLFLTPPVYLSGGILVIQKESLLASLTSVRSADIYWQTPASVTKTEIDNLLQTDAFVRAVIQGTDLEKDMDQGSDVVNQIIDAVREKVWVSTIGDDQVRVSATSEEPSIAFQLANATIETFIHWKINADRRDSETAHKFFSELIEDYKLEVDGARSNLETYLTAHLEPLKGERPIQEQLEIARLQNELDQAQARYTNALNKDEEALLAEAQTESDVHQSYILIDVPKIPEKPESSMKDLVLTLGVFLLMGFFFSLLGIVGGALLDRSFHFPLDVWHGVNLPVLTMVPDMTEGGSVAEARSTSLAKQDVVSRKWPRFRAKIVAHPSAEERI
jgi:uncharacterized protein involved in exopolysaccharide biosynthesis